MTFRDLDIKRSYESDSANLIESFYEPVLSCAVKYFRLAGFFSSSSLAVAARGMAQFIKNDGHFLLVCNPLLSKEDAETLSQSPDTLPQTISIDLNNLTDEIEKNHVKALGWMLANGTLEIKLAVVFDSEGHAVSSENISKYGIFHQKVGILFDKEDNRISFSGSVNESATAWLKNDEEFKVFRSWDGTREFVDSDLKRFQSYWCNNKTKTKVFDIPEAIKAELIQYSHDFDIEKLTVKKYLSTKSAERTDEPQNTISLFSYQQEAVNKWIANDYRLLFEMATGTGKTRTAIACLAHLLSKGNKLAIIVSCPQNTLARQWGEEINKLKVKTDNCIFADSTNPKWYSQLSAAILRLENGSIDSLMVLTTHASASKSKFTDLLKSLSRTTEIAFVGDETHWLGAGKLKEALLPEYKYRIGLSATPSRWFDEVGSGLIVNYYGNTSFEFTIADALNTINPLTNKTFLVNYMYNLVDVKLNENEGVEYQKLTHQLVRAYSIRDKSDENQERCQRLLMKRADIIKNAESKYQALENLLDKLSEKDSLHDVIIFVSPQQIECVKNILATRNIGSHELTERQGTSKRIEYGGLSEREHIIKCFKEGQYKALIAIKCLDEGIDIPTATTGILMASSTNPREYVQRIGRIIRQAPGKKGASLYDLTVLGCDFLSDEERKLDKKLREKETVRIREIARNALNSYDSETIINQYR